MAASEVLQIFPSIESLCDSTKGRPKSSVKNVRKFYHCPIQTCKYFRNEHYFEKIKFLKQHFVKVHKPKSFPCSKCGKHFPLEATLNRHKLICGVTYRCHCKAEYKAYEALLTHVKRKHQATTLKYKDMMECLKVHSTARDFQKRFDNTVKIKAIFVEDPSKKKVVYVKPTRTNAASSKETQTGMKMCKILPNLSTEMSMMSSFEQQKRTVSMQTSVMCNVRKRRRSKVTENPCILHTGNFTSSATQTTPMKDEEISSSRIFDRDFSEDSSEYLADPNMMLYTPDGSNLGTVHEENASSTGTQTNYEQNNAHDLLKADSNLIMCSDSETQTVFQDIFDNSYIDTYTQTCDALFSDLDFVDIETQTSWSIFDEKLLDGL